MDAVPKQILLLVVVSLFASYAVASDGNEPGSTYQNFSLPSLEHRLREIDENLESLAQLSLRSGIGVIGYRSLSYPERKLKSGLKPNLRSGKPEWIEVQFDRAHAIDEIVLVPTLWRDASRGFRSDGFPQELKVTAGTDADRQGTVVAEYRSEHQIVPRIGPLVVSLNPINASWVRVEATRPTRRAFDNQFVFQLSELLVFSGSENVALRQRVNASSSGHPDLAGAWDKRFVVDGHTPYLMDSSVGTQSVAYVTRVGDKPVLTLDLGDEYAIDRIHLHAVDQGDTVPQAYAGDLGIPSQLKIQGSSSDDFQDTKTLLQYQRKRINDVGPIMMWRIPKTTCRYVRLLADVSESNRDLSADGRIGFAEVELFSHGTNVALGASASTSPEPSIGSRRISTLTDGKNLYGTILTTRGWMNELASRQELQTERPLVVAELSRRYSQQRSRMRQLVWLASLLAVGIGVTFLVDRVIRIRQLAKLRSRFAADLHDELGANLHVIGLLSDLAQAAINSPEKHRSIHQRIRSMTERSGSAVHSCTNMLEAKGLYGDLLEDMQRSTHRIMADLDGELEFQGDKAILQSIKPRTRVDLFLFYKECLVNISRHSDATRFAAQLSVDSQQIQLTVSDNGLGLSDLDFGDPPYSLVRRAKLLGADVTARRAEIGGTCIVLKLPTRKWKFRIKRQSDE